MGGFRLRFSVARCNLAYVSVSTLFRKGKEGSSFPSKKTPFKITERDRSKYAVCTHQTLLRTVFIHSEYMVLPIHS